MSVKMSQEEFIARAREKHGDRYSYEKVVYVNSKVKVKIICPEHGVFEQPPRKHLCDRGCPMCGRIRSIEAHKKSLKEFTREAQKVHGNRYDYAKTHYQKVRDKVIIRCRIHGEFQQIAETHLRGHGCPECAVEERSVKQTKSTKQFIAEAREIHGDRYGYSLALYHQVNEPIKICCREHGPYLQKPGNHLQGKGCPVCGQQARIKALTYSTEQFIEKSAKIHNESYSYDETVYVNSREPVSITCHAHGVFRIKAREHLYGSGCPICRQEQIRDEKKNEFLHKAKLVFQNRYNYRKMNFQGMHRKITIFCSIHGPFQETPYNHACAQRGCPQCKIEAIREEKKAKFLENAHFFHKNRYDYSQMDFINLSKKITIICPVHGPFEQRPYLHAMQGQGCKLCYLDTIRKSRFKQRRSRYKSPILI